MQIYVPLLLVNAADDPLVHESLLSIPRALSGMLKQSAPAVHICVPAASLSHHEPWFQSSLTCLLTSLILWEMYQASLNHQSLELTRLTLSRKNLSLFRHLLLFWLCVDSQHIIFKNGKMLPCAFIPHWDLVGRWVITVIVLIECRWTAPSADEGVGGTCMDVLFGTQQPLKVLQFRKKR